MSGGKSTDAPAEGIEPLETRIVVRKLRELRHLQDNAHFMGGAEYRQLVQNIQTDGVMTSTPTVYRDEIISGNHRVDAALAAGVEEAAVIEIVSLKGGGDVSPDRLRAIALSHNAIHGQDDPGLLAEQYKKLNLQWKAYSGLNDAAFKGLKALDVKALAIGAPSYQELLVLFLPEEANKFAEAIGKVQKKLAKGVPAYAGRFEDFDRVFDAIVTAKRVKGVHNTAVALRVIAELALAKLEEEEQAAKPADATEK